MRSITANHLRRRAQEMLDNIRVCESPAEWREHYKLCTLTNMYAEDLRKLASIIDNLETEIEQLYELIDRVPDSKKKAS